jgi:hypothetical protein
MSLLTIGVCPLQTNYSVPRFVGLGLDYYSSILQNSKSQHLARVRLSSGGEHAFTPTLMENRQCTGLRKPIHIR